MLSGMATQTVANSTLMNSTTVQPVRLVGVWRLWRLCPQLCGGCKSGSGGGQQQGLQVTVVLSHWSAYSWPQEWDKKELIATVQQEGDDPRIECGAF